MIDAPTNDDAHQLIAIVTVAFSPSMRTNVILMAHTADPMRDDHDTFLYAPASFDSPKAALTSRINDRSAPQAVAAILRNHDTGPEILHSRHHELA